MLLHLPMWNLMSVCKMTYFLWTIIELPIISFWQCRTFKNGVCSLFCHIKILCHLTDFPFFLVNRGIFYGQKFLSICLFMDIFVMISLGNLWKLSQMCIFCSRLHVFIASFYHLISYIIISIVSSNLPILSLIIFKQFFFSLYQASGIY